MKLQAVYTLFSERGLTSSARHFSSVWLERGPNRLSQGKEADLCPADALTLYRSLQAEQEYELAARLLIDLLEGN
jgi:hypothetical protein